MATSRAAKSDMMKEKSGSKTAKKAAPMKEKSVPAKKVKK